MIVAAGRSVPFLGRVGEGTWPLASHCYRTDSREGDVFALPGEAQLSSL